MRVRSGVNVDQKRVLVPLIEVVWKVESDLGIVLAAVDLDVKVRDLGEVLLGQGRGQHLVGDQGCDLLVGGGLVEVVLRNVGSLAGHGVVGLVDRELEGVVAAEAFASVGHVATVIGRLKLGEFSRYLGKVK